MEPSALEPPSLLPTTTTLPPPVPVAALEEELGEPTTGADEDEATAGSSGEAGNVGVKVAGVTLLSESASLISGHLWKFPSEGSVEAAGRAQLWDDSYPRKCQCCGSCWVSDAANEKAHKRVCRPTAHPNKQADERDTTSKLGSARRVFCKVDGLQATLQWRYDSESEVWSDCICLSSIRSAYVTSDPPNAFAVLTTDSRRLVFQVRREATESSNKAGGSCGACCASQQQSECLDASQWCSLFSRLCDLEPPEATQTVNADTEEDTSDGDREDHSPATTSSGLPAGLRRLIEAGDVSSLDSLLERELGGLLETPRRDIVDSEGNSLLLLTLKLCPNDVLPEMIARVVQFGVDCNLENHELEAPLMIAAASGIAQIVRQLLETDGINVNLPGGLGVTPLHVAANSGDMPIIELLCQHGADPYAVDENGWSALHYAAACSDGVTAVHFFCELAPELIDAQCSEGNTALHVAAACGCVESVRALLETAANPVLDNASGQTPYRLALQSNKIQCALAINEYQHQQQEPAGKHQDYRSYALEGEEERVEANAAVGASIIPMEDRNVARESAVPAKIEEETATVTNGGWVECVTEDGVPFYYNTVTGVSSWFKTAVSAPNRSELWAEVEDTNANALSLSMTVSFMEHSLTGRDRTQSELGQELPLCLIPMVSPLTSLDDPTAASKLAAQRQKAREKRRKRQGYHRQERRMNW